MIQNFISMNGYGLFVWLSFAITFLACAIIYYKTYKTLKKYEKDFAKELEQLSASERKLVLEKSKVASQVLASYNKSI
jgi:heme exporter protein CcmD|tara:strand:+ start:16 stop:249 length:234 start_codon:yes stop_codon:yes gene_type:complete